MGKVESIAKAVVEKLKEMNMVENTKEMIKTSTPFVTKYMQMPFNWLLEKTPPLISTAKNWIQKAPLFYGISIGFLVFLLLRRCCGGRGGGGGGNGKTMKAPGRNNVRITRSSFERSPKAYFRNLRSKKV